MRSRRALTAVVPVLAFALAGCGGTQPAAQETSDDPVTAESCGREVTFEQTPESVLAIGAEAPALLVSAGAGDKVTHYAGTLEVPYDDETRTVVDNAEQIIDDSHKVTFEMIVNTGVDTVIGTDIAHSLDLDGLANRLEQAGIKMMTVTGYCAGIEGRTTDGVKGFDMIYNDIETYGRVFDTSETAEHSVVELKERVDKAVDSIEDKSGRTSVALYVPTGGALGGYGGEALVSEQMELVGLTNIFDDVDKRYFEPSTESIVKGEPETVVATYLPTGSSSLETEDDVVKGLRDRPELEGVDAIANDDDIIVLNYEYTSPGPLAVTGLEKLAERVNES